MQILHLRIQDIHVARLSGPCSTRRFERRGQSLETRWKRWTLSKDWNFETDAEHSIGHHLGRHLTQVFIRVNWVEV